MRIHPISENDATPQIQTIYRRIREALKIPHVPLFFQFIANFPEYMDYISNQIVENLSDGRFDAIIKTRNEMVAEILREDFDKGEAIRDFLTRYRNTPEFFYFKKDLDDLFFTNAKLVFIFISLREAVKGWAVAAKKLPEYRTANSEYRTSNIEKVEEELVFGIEEYKNTRFAEASARRVEYENIRIKAGDTRNDDDERQQEGGVTKWSQELVKREGNELTVALLPEYLKLCRNEFAELLKTQQFLFLRVELERVVLRSIDVLPHKIESPINVVLKLTKMYPNFPDLLYLLTEHFPTYAMHRWLFSAFLLL